MFDVLDLCSTFSMFVVEKIAEIAPKLNQIIADCNGKSGCMQPAVDEIVRLCLQAGVASKRYVHGCNCGIHPTNRGRSGVDPVNAQSSLLMIMQMGYSETKLENPMGFEPAVDHSLRELQSQFNEKNFAEACGYLHAFVFARSNTCQ